MIPLDTQSERCEPECMEHDLKVVDHPATTKDWDIPGSSQGYLVYQCQECGDYWGCRYQYDSGTGQDDSWHRFGPSSNFKRHY